MFISQKDALLMWDLILVMVVVSVVIFSTLIVIRFFTDRKKRLKKIRKDWMRRKILFHLENPLKDIEKEILQKKGDVRLLLEVAYDLLRNLKGASHKKILDLLAQAGLQNHVLDKLVGSNNKALLSSISLCHYWPSKDVKNRLVELLDHKNIAIKYAAGEVISNMKDLKLFPILVKKVEEEKRFSPLMICILFQNFGVEAEQKMIAALKKSKSIRMRKAILMVMAKFRSRKYVSVISKFCKHKDPEIRVLAFLALASIKDPVPLEVLEYGAKDSNLRVRKYVARCTKYSFPDSGRVLSKLLGDDNWLVGLEAAKSLIGSGFSGKQLLEVLAKSKSVAGQRAKMMLLEGGSR